ncbi:MAG: Gfo/Idh/MocA family oxidoreductase [Acidobacteria bacterium]|nr:Gfo/Idh/MocA family oxidoreductase [Acidobacteriota bacterium]
MIGVGVIGYGYWGPNLARNFAEAPNARLVAVSDRRPERLALAQARYPSIRASTDPGELIRATDVDAVVIATPVSTHANLAMAALEAGKHVLVEKPLASRSEDAERLIEEAARRGLTLMVDHTFVYTGPVRKMKDLIGRGELGELLYYDSVRVNLGLFQHDVNVLWDLAVHDLAILDYLIPQRPTGVLAAGIRHVAGQPENLAYLTLFFDNNFLAHVHVNWLAPVKIRRTLVGGSQRMVVYDDLNDSEPVRVYDKGVTVNNSPEETYKMLYSYRWGDMWAPRVEPTEALRTEAEHFVECVASGMTPLTDGACGLRMVKLLEAATRSLVTGREVVEVV